MWNTIWTYESHGLVIDRYQGDTYVTWTIRDTDGNRMGMHIDSREES